MFLLKKNENGFGCRVWNAKKNVEKNIDNVEVFFLFFSFELVFLFNFLENFNCLKASKMFINIKSLNKELLKFWNSFSNFFFVTKFLVFSIFLNVIDLSVIEVDVFFDR